LPTAPVPALHAFLAGASMLASGAGSMVGEADRMRRPKGPSLTRCPRTGQWTAKEDGTTRAELSQVSLAGPGSWRWASVRQPGLGRLRPSAGPRRRAAAPPWYPTMARFGIPAASSSRSQVLTGAASAAARQTWDRLSVSVCWRPLLSVAIVTHLVTRSLASCAVLSPDGRLGLEPCQTITPTPALSVVLLRPTRERVPGACWSA
jgi:hypothetical protein